MPQDWYLPNNLTEQQLKYCDCVLEVAGKQTETCIKEQAYGEKVEGHVCANPYPVCAKSVGTSSHCTQYYDFDKIPDIQLRGYARLKNIPIPDTYDRTVLIANIKNWEKAKYPNKYSNSQSSPTLLPEIQNVQSFQFAFQPLQQLQPLPPSQPKIGRLQ